MVIVAGANGLQPSSGHPAQTRQLGRPAPRRMRAKERNSPRRLSEPTRRRSGRPRVAATSDRCRR
jgi:hypothetical protein